MQMDNQSAMVIDDNVPLLFEPVTLSMTSVMVVINDNVPLLFEPVTLSMTSVMVKGVSGDW